MLPANKKIWRFCRTAGIINFFFLQPFFMNAQSVTNRIINPEKYYTEICKLLNKHYYYKDSLDLLAHTEKYKATFLKAGSDDSCYRVLYKMLNTLKGGHTGIVTESVLKKIQFPTKMIFSVGKLLENNVGYLKIPFCMAEQQLTIQYVDSLLNIIRKLDENYLKGWIIDLRDNGGGNSAPMITGLAPFFNNGDLCYSIDRDGKRITDRMKNGVFEQVKKNKIIFSFNPVHKVILKNNNNPVAVLVNSHTASAAERTAICLKGLANSKFFGEKTAGLTTATKAINLSDGALLYILNSVTMDMTGKIYSSEIIPHFLIDEDFLFKNSSDIVLEAAIKWIAEKL